MSAVRVGVAALAVVGTSAVPAGAADPPVVRTTTTWTSTQDESLCGGEVVPVTFDGLVTTSTVRSGSWFRVRTDVRWEQDGVRYAGRATGGFSAPPSGRATTYRIHATAVGEDGGRVQVAEVVHAVWSDGEPTVRVEFERVTCR